VDTKEVNLDHRDDALMDRDVSRDGCDEPNEFVVAGSSDTHMPVLEIAWRLQCPPKELFRVIESDRSPPHHA
jgi:hypothetical protein